MVRRERERDLRERGELTFQVVLSCDSIFKLSTERERERVKGNFNTEIELCILNMLQFHKFPI